MSRSPGLVLAALVLIIGVAACGGTVDLRSTVAVTAAPPPFATMTSTLLPRAAVAGIASRTQRLTAFGLGKDSSAAGVATVLQANGLVGAVQRSFQGESHHLTYVASRTLFFADASGARSYLAYLRAHAQDFFGTAVVVQPITSQGELGWRFQPPICACHMAEPDLTGAVAHGRHLVWLEINGPDANSAVLARLMAETS